MTKVSQRLHRQLLVATGKRPRYSSIANIGKPTSDGVSCFMQLHGIHHLTAITANARGNYNFYTDILGMRLVKKTVNQDDVAAYHLFYADGKGTPGTDLTFFVWPATPEQRGTHSIVRTGLRISGDSTFEWWRSRFRSHNVRHGGVAERDGRLTLDFEDPEGQRFSLIDDGGAGSAHPWERSSVPPEHQIRGLGPITISIPRLDRTERILIDVLGMRAVRQYGLDANSTVHVYEMGPGGPAAELHVAVEPELPFARQGAGGVHHVALAHDQSRTRRVDRAPRESTNRLERTDRSVLLPKPLFPGTQWHTFRDRHR